MKWKSRTVKSSNVDDRRGRRVASRRWSGDWAESPLSMVISLAMGKNPMELLGLVGQFTGWRQQLLHKLQPLSTMRPHGLSPVSWVKPRMSGTELFRQRGSSYSGRQPLVLFTDQVRSACGAASSAMGPFYCPGDQQIYIDLGFFSRGKCETRLGGGGEFAEAYGSSHMKSAIIFRNLTGVVQQVNRCPPPGETGAKHRGSYRTAGPPGNFRPDCYSGVWAHHAQLPPTDWLEPRGDIEQASEYRQRHR